MDFCDCCGIEVYERSMIVIRDMYYVCRTCDGYYTEEEIIEKIKEQQECSSKDT